MILYASSDRESSLNGRRRPICWLFLTVFVLNTSALAGESFFPAGVFYPGNMSIDSLVAKWYEGQLSALQEQSLFRARHDPAVQSYRFLWLRTFNHPVAIRVVIHPDGTGTLTTKMADGTGGYKPGNLVLNKTESVPHEMAEDVLDNIRRLNLWKLPKRDANTNGRDGAQWVIEGINHGKYRLVDRWTPKMVQFVSLDYISFATWRTCT